MCEKYHGEVEIQAVKLIIENLLRGNTALEGQHLSLFRSLSTNPQNSKATSDSLKGKCAIISGEFLDQFSKIGVTAEIWRGINWHRFLILPNNNQKIYADPTIGQYLSGHNHIFVGTKQQLRELIISRSDIKDPKKFFEETWGHFSRRDNQN